MSWRDWNLSWNRSTSCTCIIISLCYSSSISTNITRFWYVFFFQNINVLAHTIRHNITHISLFLSFVYIPHSLLYTCIASSIKIVELSGPKSETALVTLVDGTLFQISDLFESPTDPRSPLKLVATCRSYGVKTQFSSLQNAIAELSEKGGGKRRKVYMNKRVQEAMEKEKEKKERMAQDEAERIMLEEQQK